MNTVMKISVLGGLLAGTVDIGAAALINMTSPLRILLAIASGVLGKAAFRGAGDVMLLGLVLQWGMSVVIAGIYSLAAWRFPELARRWGLWGALYGVIVFVVMNYLVVPLSAAPFRLGFTAGKVIPNLVAMLVFGWLVAFMARAIGAPRLARTTYPAGSAMDNP